MNYEPGGISNPGLFKVLFRHSLGGNEDKSIKSSITYGGGGLEEVTF